MSDNIMSGLVAVIVITLLIVFAIKIAASIDKDLQDRQKQCAALFLAAHSARDTLIIQTNTNCIAKLKQ